MTPHYLLTTFRRNYSSGFCSDFKCNFKSPVHEGHTDLSRTMGLIKLSSYVLQTVATYLYVGPFVIRILVFKLKYEFIGVHLRETKQI